MESFEKSPAFNVEFNRQVVICNLADMELCKIPNVEEEYIKLLLAEIAIRLKETVPELSEAINTVTQEKLGVI